MHKELAEVKNAKNTVKNQFYHPNCHFDITSSIVPLRIGESIIN